MSDTNCVSAAVLVWENKMAVDQKFLKPNLDDVSGHVIFTECKILDLMWDKYLKLYQQNVLLLSVN